MRRLVAIIAVVLVACSTVSPRNQLDFGYSTVDAYVAGVKNRVLRGATTKEQATADAERATRMKTNLDQARMAYEKCQEKLPCTDFTFLMNGLQPDLLALERELREREKK